MPAVSDKGQESHKQHMNVLIDVSNWYTEDEGVCYVRETLDVCHSTQRKCHNSIKQIKREVSGDSRQNYYSMLLP